MAGLELYRRFIGNYGQLKRRGRQKPHKHNGWVRLHTLAHSTYYLRNQRDGGNWDVFKDRKYG